MNLLGINWIGIISIIICIWFAIDCKRFKRFFNNKIEWIMYCIYSLCLSISLNGFYS